MKKRSRHLQHIIYLVLSIFANSSYSKMPNDHWASVHEDDDFKNLHELTIEKFENVAIPINSSIFEPTWPLDDKTPAVLTRFGTPTTLIFSMDSSTGMIILHEALDITRSSTSISDDVLAPVDGLAIIIREEGDPSDYQTSVAILDEKSGYVTSLLHVIPNTQFSDSRFKRVKKNEVIGRLAPVESMQDPIKREEYKHIHFSVIDLKNKVLINPSNLFSNYQDSVKPSISDILLLDSHGIEVDKLIDDRIDVVINAFDNDGFTEINFELSKISVNIVDDKGYVLHSINNCNLDFLTSPIKRQKSIKDAFHLDFIGGFLNEDFYGYLTNASVQERQFSYAITNLKNSGNSCILLDDADGFIEISSETREISVEVEVYDHSNNRTFFKKLIKR